MGRGVLVGAVFAALAGAAAWWFVARPSGDHAVEVEDDGVARTEAPAAPGALAARGERGGARKGPSVVAGRIHGIVVDDAGKPLSAVAVDVSRADISFGGTTVDAADATRLANERARKTFESADAPRVGWPKPEWQATSGPDGRFVVEVDAAGAYGVAARPAAPWVGELLFAQVLPRDLDPRVTIHVVGGHPLRGRVVDSHDRPVSAVVSASAVSAFSNYALPSVASDPATGEFRWEGVPDGRVGVTARRPGTASLSVSVATPREEPVVLRFRGGGVLRGRVTDASGAPVGSADVLVNVSAPTTRATSAGVAADFPPSGSGRAKTAVDGTYRIDDTPAGKVSVVTVAAAGFRARVESNSTAPWWGAQVNEGAESVLDFVLSRGGVVSGRVVETGTGNAVPDATAFLLPSSDGPASATKSAVDAAGRFRFDDVPLGRYVLVATAPRHVLAALATTSPWAYGPQPSSDAPVVVLVRDNDAVERDVEMKPGLSIRGTVVGPDGVPVSGATVASSSIGGIGQTQWRWRARGMNASDVLATSGTDGTFRVENLPAAESATFFAQKRPFAGEPSPRVRLAAGAPEPVVTLRLVVGAVVAGRVVDTDGKPLEGRRVQASRPTGDSGGSYSGMERTDREGKFRLEGVLPGAVSIVAWGMGTPARTNVDPPLAAGEVREGIEIREGRSSYLRGQVVDDEGAPAPGRTLQMTSRASGQQATSNEDGSFDAAVPEGTYEIGEKKAGAWGIDGPSVTATAPAEGLRIVVSARPTVVVAGRVVLPDGSPVPLCVVRAGSAPSTDEWTGMSSDEVTAGLFRREVHQAPPFDVVVSAARGTRGESLNCRPKRVRVEGPTNDLVIALEPGAEVHGRVVDASGAGVAGASIKSGDVSVSTDSTGSFRLVGLVDDNVKLEIGPPSGYLGVPPKIVRAGGDDVVVTLAKGGTITGRIVGMDAALAGRVSLRTNTGVSTQVQDDGSFRLEGLPESGTVDLSLQCWLNTVGSSGSGLRPTTQKGVRVGSTDVEIRVERGASLRGIVVDAAGKPFGPGMLSVAPVHPDPGSSSFASSNSVDASGRFEVGGLAPGSYSLTVTDSDYSRQLLSGVTVDVPADNVRLTVPAPTRITGRVAGAGAGFTVRAHVGSNHSNAGTASTDAAGRFSIEVYGDGPFAVWASSRDDDRFGRARDVRAGSDVEVLLQTGLAIDGVLEQSDGTPSPSGTVSTFADYEWPVDCPVGKNGKFRLRGLPPGHYPVFGQATTVSASGQADAGATDVRLRLSAAR